MATRPNARLIRSDVVRKELAGLPADRSAASEFREGLYAPEFTDRTYAECLRRAEEALFAGECVIIDASFGDEKFRQQFLAAGRRWAVPALFLLCEAQSQTVAKRLAARRGDPSDADWSVYLNAAKQWEPLSPETACRTRIIPTGDSAEAAEFVGWQTLCTEGLADGAAT